MEENQHRLRQIIGRRFSPQQQRYLNEAFYRFQQGTGGIYGQEVFGRRYLIAMILKELNRNQVREIVDTTPEQEFNFLKAYLLVVDVVNAQDRDLLDEASKHQDDRLKPYRMIWTPNITQYEFADPTNAPFEMLKLMSFCLYALRQFRQHLKDYLQQLGHQNLSTFIGSFYQVAMAASQYREGEQLSKLNFIRPKERADDTHLKALSINGLIGKQVITFPDLKKLPLFHNRRDGYMVIDEALYAKKQYKGPFFELRNQTALKREMGFNEYSSTISKDVIEGVFFQAILRSLQSGKHEVLHFDDGSDLLPDAYRRKNKIIFLIEFKAYLFPDDLSVDPSFDKIKNYIDSRFVANEKGKAKGVGQLINQLSMLKQNKYEFDRIYVEQLREKRITVYPIICHNEFHFSLAGINEYLNDEFQQQLTDTIRQRIDVRNLTLVNLEHLYDMGLRGGNFDHLQQMVDRYWKIVSSRKQQLKKETTIDHYLRARSSFDEIYQTLLQKDLGVIKSGQGTISRLTDLLGLNQEILDRAL